MLLPEDYHRNIFQPEFKAHTVILRKVPKRSSPRSGQGEFLKDEKETFSCLLLFPLLTRFFLFFLSNPNLVCMALCIGRCCGNKGKLVSLESICCWLLLKKQV